MKKKKITVFNGVYYLLGQDSEETNYYLQAPSWDCEWYWGFGYITTFTNNKCPEKSRDIESHQHADKFYPEWMGAKNSFITNPTFSVDEGWEMAELFKQFYFLKDAADHFERGKCHVADTKIELWKKPWLTKEINEEILPKVMNRIIEILTPKD